MASPVPACVESDKGRASYTGQHGRGPGQAGRPRVSSEPLEFLDLPFDIRHQILIELPFEDLLSQMRQLSHTCREDFFSLIQSIGFMQKLAQTLQEKCEAAFIHVQVEIASFMRAMETNKERFPYAIWLNDPESAIAIEVRLKSQRLVYLPPDSGTEMEATETLHTLLTLSCKRHDEVREMRDRFRSHVHRQIKRTKMTREDVVSVQEVLSMNPTVFSSSMVDLARLVIKRLEAYREANTVPEG